MSHFYFSPRVQAERLFKEWREHKKIVIAYDYDNTVYDYHNQGHDYSAVVKLLQDCHAFGAHLILFTAAGPERYDEIRQYLSKHDIPCDSINENAPGLPFALTAPGQKIYYNILLDDRAGLRESFEILQTTLRKMKHQLVLDTNYFQQTPKYLSTLKTRADGLEAYMRTYQDLSAQQYLPTKNNGTAYPVMPDHITFNKDYTVATVHGYPVHSYVSLRQDVFILFYNFFKLYNMLHLLPAHMHKNLFRVSMKQNTLRYRQSRQDTITLDLPDTFYFFSRSRSLEEAQYVPHADAVNRNRAMKALCLIIRDTLCLGKKDFFNISDANNTSLNVSLTFVQPTHRGNPVVMPQHTL